MKKLTFTFLLSFLFFTTSIFSQSQTQKWEFGFTLKSNFINLDVDDEIYNPKTVVSGNATSGYFSSSPLVANRTMKGKMGIEGGLQVKYNLSKKFSLVTGLEGRLIRFAATQEMEEIVNTVSSFSFLGNFAIPGQAYGVVEGSKILRDDNGFPILEIESPSNFQEIQQSLFYLNFPINIAYTFNSQKWIVFGGLNYSYLLTADIEKSSAYPNDAIPYFNKNFIGVNLGVDYKMSKHISISLNYTGLASNIYSATKTVRTYNSDYTEYIKVDEQNPASKNFNLFSLGLTYKL